MHILMLKTGMVVTHQIRELFVIVMIMCIIFIMLCDLHDCIHSRIKSKVKQLPHKRLLQHQQQNLRRLTLKERREKQMSYSRGSYLMM